MYRPAYGRFDDLISTNFVETLNEWIFSQAACDMFSEKNSGTFSTLAGFVLLISQSTGSLSTIYLGRGTEGTVLLKIGCKIGE